MNLSKIKTSFILSLSSYFSTTTFAFVPPQTTNHASILQPPLMYCPMLLQQPLNQRLYYDQTRLYQSDSNEGHCSNIKAESSSLPESYLQELNPSQHEAVTQPIPSITRVIAGPGAGKTKVLTSRIAYLLDHSEERSKILAVTFTKKAAMEMQHRLTNLLSTDTPQEEEEVGVGEQGEIYQEEYGDQKRRIPSKMDRVTLGTFHSICAKILRWYGSELQSLPSISSEKDVNLNGHFVIIDQSDQLRLIKECVTSVGIDLSKEKNKRGNENLRPITILNAVGTLKSEHRLSLLNKLPPQDESQGTPRKMSKKLEQIAQQIYPLYQSHLISQNTLDFDDLIHYTHELLHVHPSIRQALQKRWSHVLVDEFQDTSKIQLELVKLWCEKSLFVVGDGNQSIYSWRGAHVGSMERFVEEFENGVARDGKDEGRSGVNTVYLMENYRSTSNIIKAAQKIISASPSSSLQAEMRQDIMKPMRGSGPTPRILACSDAKAEASFIVKTVHEMTDKGDLTPQSSIAILYRTNAQSRAIEEACVAENLRYVVRGSAGTFYSRAEVKDCLCFLRLLYNGRDRAAFLRAVKTPSRGIGEVALKEFFAYCEELDNAISHQFPERSRFTLLDALISLADEESDMENYDDDNVSGRMPPLSSIVSPKDVMSNRALNRFIPFAIQMKRFQQQAYVQTVSALLSTIMTDFDLRSHFDSISKTSDEFAERLSNAMELCAAAERYADDGPCLVHPSAPSQSNGVSSEEVQISESPLGNFLDDVSLLVDADEDSAQNSDGDGRVVANLMTIHASKGMEFDAVFIIGNEEGTFPTQRALIEGEGSVELEEERRLCYVAMTRAKTNLVLTWRREVMTFFGQGFKVKDTDRSRFLDTLLSKKMKKTKKKKTTKTKKSKLARDGEEVGNNLLLEERRQLLQRKMSNDSKNQALPKSPQGGSWSEWKPSATNNGRQSITSSGRRAKQDWMRLENRTERPTTARPSNKRRDVSSLSRSKSPQGGSWEEWKPPTNNRRIQNGSAPRQQQASYSGRSPVAANRRPSQRQQHTHTQSRPAKRPPMKYQDGGGDGVSFDTFLSSNKKSTSPSDDGNAVPQVDSTMFFAVGSTIRHSIHGQGTVLPPPKEDTMRVRVRFDNEMEIDFPISGSGLQHVN